MTVSTCNSSRCRLARRNFCYESRNLCYCIEMLRHLLSWVSQQDLKAAQTADLAGSPNATAILSGRFGKVTLLDNLNEKDTAPFFSWLANICSVKIERLPVELKSSSDLGEIYKICERAIADVKANSLHEGVTFHISPGTSTMSAVWVLLAAQHDATMIRSNAAEGVIEVEMPFDVAAEFRAEKRVERLAAGEVLNAEAFERISYRSPEMRKVIQQASIAASVPARHPILIEGPTGTGKELIARAIHLASPRKSGPFIEVNCGAIPTDLIEAELFGFEKGAFTGAIDQRKGKFEAAHQGTIFLDEIGELPLSAQVRLLRVLQERNVQRLGSTQARAVDVKVIAATHRSLPGMIASGAFREDLMYRLMVINIKVPALCDRRGDLSHLIDLFLEQINKELSGIEGFRAKKLTVRAHKILLQHQWPGNVRELQNTLVRCAYSAFSSDEIDKEIVEGQLLKTVSSRDAGVLGRPLGEDFKLEKVLAEVATHYLRRADAEANGVKERARQLLGFNSAQVYSKWMERHGLASSTRKTHLSSKP